MVANIKKAALETFGSGCSPLRSISQCLALFEDFVSALFYRSRLQYDIVLVALETGGGRRLPAC
ncbi:MAG: hypothetical protein ACN4GW_21250 [Desulforhopalus sp.]